MSKNIVFSHFDFISVGKEVLNLERNVLTQLHHHININFQRACEMIFNCQGKVIVMGMGKSGHIGRKIASTFSSTGTSSFFVHPGEASHGDLGMISSKDIVLILSHSGESTEIVELIPFLERFQIPIIGITGTKKNSISQVSKIHLHIHVSKEACPLGLVPTASTTAALVIGDALALSLAKARGFTAENFSFFHPGGILGKKSLLRVKDIMYSKNEIPLISPRSKIRDALIEISKKDFNIAIICDKKNNVLGLLTGKELRDLFKMNINFDHVCVSEIMIKNFIQISLEASIIEAFETMKEHNITTISVTKNNQILGIVRMRDIIRSKIVCEKIN